MSVDIKRRAERTERRGREVTRTHFSVVFSLLGVHNHLQGNKYFSTAVEFYQARRAEKNPSCHGGRKGKCEEEEEEATPLKPHVYFPKESILFSFGAMKK